MAAQSTLARRYERALHKIADLFALFGGLGLFFLMAVTVVSVFWRYVLRDPIFGIEDLSTMALTVVVAAGVGFGSIHGAHISVHIITSVFGRGVTRLTDVFSRVAGIGICGFATWGLIKKGSCGIPCGLITQNLNIPHEPFFYVLAASMELYGAVLVYHLFVGFAHWSGTDPNEGET
jgi:TRAP-type C4-dicarboxylate transport system permease small subunit